MEYDLYDFDKTVFPVDSESVFYLFCLVRRPWLIVLLPYQLICLACFFLKIGGDRMKGRFFCFLRFINTDKMVKKFWEKNEKHIYPFFRPENRDLPAVVCSASPEFLLKPICEKYKVHTLIATRLDPHTGKMDGLNCKDCEKVVRINAAIPGAKFDKVFSDSLKSDAPIFALGRENYHAVKGKLTRIK